MAHSSTMIATQGTPPGLASLLASRRMVEVGGDDVSSGSAEIPTSFSAPLSEVSTAPGRESSPEWDLMLPRKVELWHREVPQKLDMESLCCAYSSPPGDALDQTAPEVPWPHFGCLLAAGVPKPGASTAGPQGGAPAPSSGKAQAAKDRAALGAGGRGGHEAPAIAGDMTAGALQQRQRIFMKTQACRFFAKGWCRSGTNCAFAHSAEEMRDCPDLTKTSICHRWARHQCPRTAKECRYAHGAWDLRRT